MPTGLYCFHDLLLRRPEGDLGRLAVIEGETRLDYGGLGRRVHAMAGWLIDRGLRPGDRVGVHLRKSIEEIVVMLGTSLAGGVTVNINHQWTPRQRDHVLNDCAVRFLVTNRKGAKGLDADPEVPALEHVLIVDGEPPTASGVRTLRFESGSTGRDEGRRVPRPDRIGNDLAAILYTSGSTGMPKGVMLTHANLIEGARCVADYLDNRPEDRLLSLLPFSFDYGLNQLTTMLLVGGSLVLQVVPMASEIVKSLREHACTGFAAVPPTWRAVVSLLLDAPCELPSLRYVTNSGGKIPPDTLEALPRVFPGADIVLMYGLTEAFRSTFLAPHMFEAKKGSMGIAIPNNQVFVIDDSGVAKTGEIGELVHRGPLVSAGYWGNPQATAEKIGPCRQLEHLIGREPVVYSGDLVRRDEDGYLWFVGRRDQMIKSSGFRIAPVEIEDVVAQHPNVREVVAFGVDDPDLGQVVHVALAVVDATPAGIEDVRRHCGETMPSYMVPRHYHVHDGPLPRTSSGKLDAAGVARMYRPAGP